MAEAREEILGKIRAALKNKSTWQEAEIDPQEQLYIKRADDAVVEFDQQFRGRQGNLTHCISVPAAVTQINEFLKEHGYDSVFAWEPEVINWLSTAPFEFTTNEENLHSVEVGITTCECLITRTGSLVVTSKQAAGRRLTIYPPVHVVIAFRSQLVPDVEDGIAFIRNKYGAKYPSMISFVTGASRTADIEKTLVLGAHGPKELHLFLVDDRG